MSFQVPYESSSPSTPGKSRSLFSNLSTTPSGVPPSASNSFTPSGHPPSSTFGSSHNDSRMQFNSSQSLFTKSGNVNPNDSIFGSSIGSDFAVPKGKKSAAPARSFAPSHSIFSINSDSNFGESINSTASNEFTSSQMEEEADQDAEGEEMEHELEDEAEDDMEIENRAPAPRFDFLNPQFGNAMAPQPPLNAPRKSIYSNPGNAKRPKLNEKWANQSPLRKGKLSPKKDSAMPSIVRNFALRSRVAAVDEPSDIIISTEDEICRMYDEARQAEYQETNFRFALAESCDRLTRVWKAHAGRAGSTSSAAIGPGDHAPNVAKAAFLGSLLVQLHHPPLANSKPNGFSNLGFAAPQSLVLSGARESTPTPIPKVLLDWLDANHPQLADLQVLKEAEPNPTASSNFWELINAAVLRGHLSEAAKVLRSADFNYARSALEDGLPQSGYRGAQLQNIQRCVNKALQILDSCPSQHGDWDVRGIEWTQFRKRVMTAVTDLEEFAEGDEQQESEAPGMGNRFQAVNFGLGPSAAGQDSFSQSARMAESRVPWTIYQSLRSLYRIIVGDTRAIMNHSQDWVEATIGLTVWWDGEGDEETDNDFAMSNFLRPRGSKPKPFGDVDGTQEESYIRRLDLAFNNATSADSDDAGFRVNSLSQLEVGLASVFENNVHGVLELLQTWSLCIASATAEVAAAGGWLAESGGKALPGLSADDLMVLSYGQDDGMQKHRVDRDDMISTYASGLFERRLIQNKTSTREGWEFALEVLSRLNDNEKMQKSVSELVDKLPFDTAEQMDKVVLLCSELGLDKEGRRVSERYGDITVSKSEEYGLALMCYSRAHCRRKVKSVVDLLISYSLVQSRAYPATADLDEQLYALIKEPKIALEGIAAADEEAASILQFYFSGYATLRRYYDIRDETIGLEEGQKPRHKPLARRRAAAQALVACISSAADSIYGGLYDPDRDSAVQVDGLLALLGEVLPFINQPTPIMSVSEQTTVLSAIEDLETVTPRVYSQCEECFHSTLIEYQSSQRATLSNEPSSDYVLPPSPRALLKKSVSSLTASSTFSFIGSDMIESARTRSGPGSTSSSGVLVPRIHEGRAVQERGWDWRTGLSVDTKGEEILRMLRLGLARGLSFGGLGSI